jgi:hypothetical protein
LDRSFCSLLVEMKADQHLARVCEDAAAQLGRDEDHLLAPAQRALVVLSDTTVLSIRKDFDYFYRPMTRRRPGYSLRYSMSNPTSEIVLLSANAYVKAAFGSLKSLFAYIGLALYTRTTHWTITN